MCQSSPLRPKPLLVSRGFWSCHHFWHCWWRRSNFRFCFLRLVFDDFPRLFDEHRTDVPWPSLIYDSIFKVTCKLGVCIIFEQCERDWLRFRLLFFVLENVGVECQRKARRAAAVLSDETRFTGVGDRGPTFTKPGNHENCSCSVVVKSQL